MFVDRWVQAHQVFVNWNEAQANRDNPLTSTPWNVQYVGLNDIDAKSGYESTNLFQTGQTGTWKTWDLTALTQKWVNGSATNYGVVLWATNEATDGYDLRFYSSEYTVDPTKVPKLEIIYSRKARTVYFLKDHLGSIRATVWDTLNAPVVGYDDYDPWGYILANRSQASTELPTTTRNKFTEKEWDDEFGLNWNYFGARYYDPQIGRWLTRDPLAERYPQLSPYVYAANNPVKFIDPNGECYEFNSTDSTYTPCADGEEGDTRDDAFGFNWTFTDGKWQLTNGSDAADYYYTAIDPDGTASYYVKRYLEYIKKYNSRPPDYYLGYGHYNFMKFQQGRLSLSATGQQWAGQTAIDLQKAMERGLKLSRGNVEQSDAGFTGFAYGTHVDAYTNSGLIYVLPIIDLANIVTTPSLEHFIRGIPQAAQVGLSLYNYNHSIVFLRMLMRF